MTGTIPFDAVNSDLSGPLLIEASAGTGKTYSLMHILLRLIVEKEIPLERILLVTYTTAATQEMKTRLRELLRQTEDDLAEGKTPKDKLLASQIRKWISGTGLPEPIPLETIIERIHAALNDIENNSVFTIHSFCQKMLLTYGFSSGNVKEREVGSDDEILAKVTEEKIRELIRNGRPDFHEGTDFVTFFKEADGKKKDFWVSAVKAVAARPDDEGFGSVKFSTRHAAKDPKPGRNLPKETEDEIRDWLKDTAREVDRQKQKAGIQTFEDMLLRMYETVRSNPDFAQAVRSQFGAILIDEFQDTDPLQYSIFEKLFLNPEHPFVVKEDSEEKGLVCFVGDPKQSIYSFRASDLDTYFYAKKQVGREETLERNFRSFEGVVQGVNRFFTCMADPFGEKDLEFHPTSAGTEQFPLVKKTGSGFEAVPAFEIWINEAEMGKLADDIRRKEAEAIASDILALLAGETYLFDKGRKDWRRVRPSDFAVIVSKRSQAKFIVESLANRGIRTLKESKDNIFKAREAKEILFVLQALEEPENSKKMTQARATRIFGESLRELLEDEDLLQSDRVLLEELGKRFSAFGITRIFKKIFREKETAERLLCQKEGERALTNYDQLIELLNKESVKLKTPAALIRRLEKLMNNPPDNEDSKLRRESDSDVVRIETIHHSKGLEYPIVYLVQASGQIKAPDETVVTLHTGRRHDLYLNPFTTKSCGETVSGEPESELLQKRLDSLNRKEEVRKAYVAMTRARLRVVISLIQGFIKSAPGLAKLTADNPYFLAVAQKEREAYETLLNFGERCASDNEALQEKLQKMAEGEPFFEGRPLEFPDPLIRRVAPETIPTSAKRFRPYIQEGPEASETVIELKPGIPHPRNSLWSQNSFTSLLRGVREVEELKGADEGREALESFEASPEDEDYLSFGGGAAFGDFLHRLIEHLDFSLGKPGKEKELGDEIRRFFKFNGRVDEEGNVPENEAEAMQKMFVELTNAEIFEGIKLCNVGKGQRSPELEFLLGCRTDTADSLPLSAKELADALRELDPEHFENFSLDERSLAGFITGTMDLIFEAKGKYWLIDWKSNYARSVAGELLKQAHAYRGDNLKRMMDHHHYHLQYLLYLVGMRRFLNLRLQREDSYELIGGAGYVFLRGVRQKQKGQGVYAVRPSEALIECLDTLLTQGYSREAIEKCKAALSLESLNE